MNVRRRGSASFLSFLVIAGSGSAVRRRGGAACVDGGGSSAPLRLLWRLPLAVTAARTGLVRALNTPMHGFDSRLQA